MVTLALVGKGQWGKNYIKTISNLSSCQLPDKFIKTRNYRDLFSQNCIDGVIIATPASTHFQIAKEFLEKGFNVLVEKPAATNYNDALELYKVADRFKKVLMVGHIFLYNPAFIEIKNLLKSVGKIKYIASESMDYGPIRSDISSLWDWAPHDISMCLEILGDLPIEVSGYGFNILRQNRKLYDMCYLKLRFPNNIFVCINVGWVSPIKKRNLLIAGEKGSISFDDTIQRKISVVKNINGDKKFCYPSFPSNSPLSMEIEVYVDLIERGNAGNYRLKTDLYVIKILEACEKSIQTDGKTIKLADSK